MKKIVSLLLLFLFFNQANAQHVLKAIILDEETKQPLIGASAVLTGTGIGATSDTNGRLTLTNIPAGNHTVIFSYVGYESLKQNITFPTLQDSLIIYLEPAEGALKEVMITSTRTSRTISDIPTRVEAITAEELEEKANMQPGNIRMVLSESTGIQVQQTSATSANASIRIQGLDAKYTQLLRDGFPLYSGFSGGLGLLQIPPLDLRQVEVIKGSSSTLYGGGAIAGLINLVTKEPQEERELTFMANQTTAVGTDLNGYYSQKFNKTGVTVFSSVNTQRAYDPNKDDFSDLPEYRRYTLNPRFFVYPNQNTKLYLGVNATTENRLGGDMQVIKYQPDDQHTFVEKNISDRLSTQFNLEKTLTNNRNFNFKNSLSYFNRSITLPNYRFAGTQYASFTEANYNFKKGNLDWLLGGNIWTDQFREDEVTAIGKRNYNHFTTGAFVQNNWEVTPSIALESGLRTDYHNQYGLFILPRVSALFRLSTKLTSRLGGGYGYKAPTIFSEESEVRAFRNILPLAEAATEAEKSVGANFDVNYRTTLFEVISFSVNQFFFYTQLANPLILTESGLGNNYFEFTNSPGFLDSRGFETNVKAGIEDLTLYLGYSFTDARQHHQQQVQPNPLTAKHRLNTVLMYEVENKARIGYELFYTGRQYLSTGTRTPDYWVMGFSAEKKWKHLSIFGNLENFLDTRQSRFSAMFTGPRQSPVFPEIYAPTEGFIANAGFRIML